MPSRPSRLVPPALTLALSLAGSPLARADEADVLTWSQTAARGLFDLCREDAPDASAVAEHGEAWGWPAFMGYLEHPDGYKREAGGESRRTYEDHGLTSYVEATVQSGEVTSAAPANIAYFRCNMATDHAVGADLAAYFTGLYGPPASDTAEGKVWLIGAAKGAPTVDDDAMLSAVIAAGAGAQGARIEVSRDLGVDRAKMTLFRYIPVS